MSINQTDPTEPMRLKAGSYLGVDEGTACTQSSFKVGKKGFLYVGMQGGRYKAMFKLKDSIPEATELAESEPNCYEVGKFGWVTTRFSAEQPIPNGIWEKWLDESYGLASAGNRGKKSG